MTGDPNEVLHLMEEENPIRTRRESLIRVLMPLARGGHFGLRAGFNSTAHEYLSISRLL